MRQCGNRPVAAIVMRVSGAGKSTVRRQRPVRGEDPIAVDIDRPVIEIKKSIFGVLYLAARKPR